jgi:hypothetical protein
MRYWVVAVSARRYAEERAVRNSLLRVEIGAAVGDQVVLVADDVVFGLAAVVRDGWVRYTRRLFDAPLPAGKLAPGPLSPEAYAALAAQVRPAERIRTWMVGVDLPIEAESPGEAVRQYWSYLRELGPGELPAYVSPAGDELAMQAYLLGEATNLDPEED